MVGATLSLTVVAAVFMANPWLGARLGDGSQPTVGRRHLATEIEIWVADLGDDAKAVLGPVWGQAGADLEHDRLLRERLGVADAGSPAFQRLLVFNRGAAARPVALGDRAIRFTGPGAEASLRSVPSLLASAGREPSPALRAVLGARGTLSRSVEVPPGQMADLLVAFEGPVRLRDATAVEGWDGIPFRRRRMERTDLEALIEGPDPERIREL